MASCRCNLVLVEADAAGTSAASKIKGRVSTDAGSYLLRELGDGESAVLLVAAAGERREADHEEVQAWEGDQVDRQLAQVSVQLACK